MPTRTIKQYSTAFKRHVVVEIEAGRLNIAQAKRRYGIGSRLSIQRWLKQYGRHDHRTSIMRIQKPEEVDQLKHLEQQKQALESALAQAHVKILALESTIEVASVHFGVDVKKNFGTKRSSTRSSTETKPTAKR